MFSARYNHRAQGTFGQQSKTDDENSIFSMRMIFLFASFFISFAATIALDVMFHSNYFTRYMRSSVDQSDAICKKVQKTLGGITKCAPRHCFKTDNWKARFGNAFYALYRSFILAEHVGIDEIHIPYYYSMYTKSFTYRNISLIVDPADNTTEDCYEIWPFEHLPGVTYPSTKSFDYDFKKNFAIQFEDVLVDLPKDILSIHVRSGDIFGSDPHPSYGQPPCGYYREIIETGNWSKIFLFAEDRLNPCIDVVRSYGALHVQGKLRNEIGLMVSSRNLVIGHGTFGMIMGSISAKIENMWTCGYDKEIFGVPHHFDCAPTDEYNRDVMGGGKWHNTKKQREMMMESNCKGWKIVEDAEHQRRVGKKFNSLAEIDHV